MITSWQQRTVQGGAGGCRISEVRSGGTEVALFLTALRRSPCAVFRSIEDACRQREARMGVALAPVFTNAGASH